MTAPVHRVMVTTTDKREPITVTIDGAPIKVHSIEYRRVEPDLESLMSPYRNDEYELLLRVRPAEDGVTLRVFVPEGEVDLDAIKMQGSLP